jgi:hypothetical protein
VSDKVTIELELLTKAFNTAIKDATKQAKGFGDEAEKSFKGVGNSFSVMAGNLAANAITSALSAITGSFGRMLDEAQAAENALNSLKFALKSAGIYSETAVSGLTDFADALSKVTTHDDDLIVKNQALLLSLTNLSGKGVNEAVKAAANLAAVLNIDLSSATEMVSKAINGNTASFGKLGIEIRKGKTDAEQFANVMGALDKFSGAATAATNTFSGALAQQDNATGNLLQSLGEVVTQNPAVIQGIKDLTSAAVSATEWIVKNKDALTGLVTSGIEVAKSTASVVTSVAQATAEIGKYSTGAANAASINSDLSDSLDVQAEAELKLFNQRDRGFNITNSATQSNAKFIDSLLGGTVATVDGVTQTMISNVVVGEATRIRRGLTDEQQKAIDTTNAYVDALAKENENIAGGNQIKLDTLATFYANKEALDSQAEMLNFDNKLAREEAYYTARTAIISQGYNAELDKINQSTVAEDVKGKARVTLQAKYNAQFDKASQEHNAKQQAYEKAAIEQKKKDDAFKLSSTASLFGSLATLLAGASKANFNTVKNLMLAEATLSGYLAVQRALASGPPPWNYVAAAAVGISTAANIQKINSQSAPAFQDGGIVGGSSMSGDKIMARVNSGEMVINKQQQSNLFKMANSGGSGNTESLLIQLISAVNDAKNTSINIDGREIINVVRGGLASGRTL